jgi:hypothetical protein
MAVRKEGRRSQCKIDPSKPHPSDLLPPTRPHLPQFYQLPTVYSDFESTSGLKHSLGQSPHNPIISGNPSRLPSKNQTDNQN